MSQELLFLDSFYSLGQLENFKMDELISLDCNNQNSPKYPFWRNNKKSKTLSIKKLCPKHEISF